MIYSHTIASVFRGYLYLMLLPDKYIRAAYKAVMAPVMVYDTMPPADAEAPYIVITSIESIPSVTRCISWASVVTVTIFSEFQEFGQSLTVNDIAEDLINAVGIGTNSYLSIDNFGNENVLLVSSLNDYVEVGSVNIYRQVLRISHILNPL